MLQKIDPKDLKDNVFSLIGERWALITAGTRERCNTMTASWGGLGVLWNKPVATVYIRPQRYTYRFAEETGSGSLRLQERPGYGQIFRRRTHCG